MRLLVVLLASVFNFIYVENRMIPRKNPFRTAPIDASEQGPTVPIDGSAVETELKNDSHQLRGREIIDNEKVLGLKIIAETEDDTENDKKYSEEEVKEPCAIVVVSNIQNPNMQSLIRKYRYDANGELIPSSVKYFMKLPQGLGLTPVLVPLNDKAFSPLGGFVRYYKEVPPIPHSW